MLDVITDFWKPVKKPGNGGAPDLSTLQIGSTLTFGYVPQVLLSGRKLRVSSINTYRFNDERMTSFVLAQEGDEIVSLIVASSGGEQYLALSRRIPFAERMKMFDPSALEAVVEQAETVRLGAQGIETQWKHWVVPYYKKEISGVRGSVVRGDFRQGVPPEAAADQNFDYVLLTSDSNEYAIEIERYSEGRLELYATIYRRLNDIVEVESPESEENALSAPPVIPAPVSIPAAANGSSSAPVLEIVKPESKPEPKAEAKQEPAPALAEKPPVAPPVAEKPAEPVAAAPAPAPREEKKPEPADAAPQTLAPTTTKAPLFQPIQQPSQPEKKPMQFPMTSNASNGAYADKNPELRGFPRNADAENDAIECDLRVANKIIEEAIRNEMRLSDVVRRVIALPVSNPDSVQIPITLSDSDFALLAIRYSMPASDKNAIKAKIIEELGDFSGGKK